jgi:DNA-binding transcriptional LysR family regulator
MNFFDFWHGLDLRQLIAFQVVAETQSFAEAARRLGYTQPAVSYQVASLERVVGHRLIDRSSGRSGATLTAAGAVLAAHVKAFAARLACARADLDALEAGEVQTLRVGAFQSVAARILPRVVPKLADAAPGLTIELAEAAHELEMLDRVAYGDLDFAFTLLPLEDERLAFVELLHDPYYLVADSALGPIDSLADLKDTPLIAPRSCRSVHVIDAHLRGAGVSPTYAFRTDDDFALKGFVQNRAGVAFVSRLTLDTLGGDLASTPVDHLIPDRRIALTWARGREAAPYRESFVALTREACGEIAAEIAALRA